MNLLRLSQITANDTLLEQAQKTLAHFSESISEQPSSAPQMLAALNFSLVKAKQVVFAAKPDDDGFQRLLRSLHKSFVPNKIVLLADGAKGQAMLGKQLAFIKTVEPIQNKATAYVCENFVCQLPTVDVTQFEKLITGRNPN